MIANKKPACLVVLILSAATPVWAGCISDCKDDYDSAVASCKLRNIRKREVATHQLLNHLRDTIATAIPSIKSVIIGGDFNTNKDQPIFASEKTLSTLTDAGFRNCMEGLPLLKRVTHPGNHGYPDATFDYLFSANAASRPALITPSDVSDHYPVTCDFTMKGGNE